jgi:transglutaminase-like putative cysteine protease
MEIEAVVRILSRVRESVRYACGKDLCEPVYRVDALATLDKGIGNCVCYANLALALLRAAGIPAKYVTGIVADRTESHAAHAWISAYFPSWGWVEFESADWMPASGLVPRTFNMPQHITIYTGGGFGITKAPFSELHEIDYEVLSHPEIRTGIEGSVGAGSSVSWFITVSSPVSRTIDLEVRGLPPGWYGAFAQGSIEIDADSGPLHSYDVLFTVVPPPTAKPGDEAEITLSGSSGGALLGEMTVRVRVDGEGG